MYSLVSNQAENKRRGEGGRVVYPLYLLDPGCQRSGGDSSVLFAFVLSLPLLQRGASSIASRSFHPADLC